MQDIVVTQRGFFHHIYYIGCAFNLHSITNSGLTLGGQNSSKRQTVLIWPIDPRDKEHNYPEQIDLNEPRRAQYLHSAWKKHQDAVFWVDIDLAIRKGLTFCQTRSNAIILQGTLPAHCIVKVERLKTGEVSIEKAYISPRPPPNLAESRLDKGLGFESGWTTRRRSCSTVTRRSCQTGKILPTNQFRSQFCDRSGQLVDTQDVSVVKGETSRSQEIKVKSFHEELCSSHRSGQLDITLSVIRAQNNLSEEIRVEQTHDRSGQPDKHSRTTSALEKNREITVLNTDNELLVKELRRTWTSKFQDYHILL